jgi:hypothetical protein
MLPPICKVMPRRSTALQKQRQSHDEPAGIAIYQTTVPAGPFNIEDLRSSVRGTLDVRVEEQDGTVQTFSGQYG